MTAPAPPAGTPYRSGLRAEARDGFGRLLLAEWTKLRTVPRWMLALLASVLLTVLVALLSAAGTDSTGSGGQAAPPRLPAVFDLGHYTYRPLAGDGSIVARVASQDGGGAWAKAGLMIRGGTQHGTPYAALMVTPGHGVRLQTGYESGGQGGGTAAPPRWLKLTRTGTTVTGYHSPDGRAWHRVGSVRLDGLPERALAGMFAAAPDQVQVRRQFGGESISGSPGTTRATFDHVSVSPAAPGASWRDRGTPGGPASDPDADGRTESGGTFTLKGTGDIGPDRFADDVTRTTLTGALIGQAAIVALAVLFVTAEFRRGMLRTTFAASPRRGRVLAAKAAVVGLASLAAGLAAAFGAVLLAGPVLRSHGMSPPPLSDGAVLRAVLGTGALLGVVAVFSLAVAVIVRRSAPAITIVLLLLLVPQIVATGLPLSAARWLERLTPAAGFAVQQTVTRFDQAIAPWAGFGVLCAYTAAALALAARLIRKRDA
ncbi:ABC transporter permease subunit [Actinomadura bangladeshensis]|uniref:ABC transporter permease n=1 Tax=Actinomadura bangladeshensis TaxID=453573 RepID=A0A4R4NGZ6_9ACTN|nr:ABC transporter permease subunit [Actinomadura bangladeshensis]TDC06627.1 ABC transporter permease [Actinomadura bangladeshensis]